MNDFSAVEILDRLAQLLEPLDDLYDSKGLGALFFDACGEVAINAILHQQAHLTIHRYSLIVEVSFNNELLHKGAV